MSTIDNEKRLIASQIIVDLYDNRKMEQLKILRAQISTAVRNLEIEDKYNLEGEQ